MKTVVSSIGAMTLLLAIAAAPSGAAGKVPVPERAESGWRLSAPSEILCGDIVFRRGHGFWTGWFINASIEEKRYSHTGIAVSSGRDPWIIHAEANDDSTDGFVKRTRWHDFQRDSTQAAVYRFPADESIRRKIAACAEKRLGVAFDSAFSVVDTNRLYCSEFVREAVNEAFDRDVIPIIEKNGVRLITVDACYLNGAEPVFRISEE